MAIAGFWVNLKKDKSVITLLGLLMINSGVKQFILPYSAQQVSGNQAEAAAVFTYAEQSGNKNPGVLLKQTTETLTFVAKLGYPLWVYPQTPIKVIFDGLKSKSHTVSIMQPPSAAVFIDKLEFNQRPRERYISFLLEYGGYFQQSTKEASITVPGFIVDEEFKDEFDCYYKQAIELTTNENLIAPLFNQKDVALNLEKIENTNWQLREEKQKLVQCIEQLQKLVSQHLTELEYETAAVKEEIEAKIKAQQEFINPQIAKLDSEYRQKTKRIADKFNAEIERLEKQKIKNGKTIASNEGKIRAYEVKAKTQSKKGHKIYEKRWKQKLKNTQKTQSKLKKEQKNIQKEIERLSKQKDEALSAIKSELEAKIEAENQPLNALKSEVEMKVCVFEKEKTQIQTLQAPIIHDIEKTILHLEAEAKKLVSLGLVGLGHQLPDMYYVPFYIIGYSGGLTQRCVCVAPSDVNSINFSVKLKSSLGLSVSKNLLARRFKKLSELIEKTCSVSGRKDDFCVQLWSLAEKNNLLKRSEFQAEVKKGLVYLKGQGWLSEDETIELADQLKLHIKKWASPQ